jgi:hypothetical protein
MILCEGVRLEAFEVEDAEQPVLHNQRHDQFRLDVRSAHAPNVSWVGSHMVHPNRLAFKGGVAAQPFAQCQSRSYLNPLVVLQRERERARAAAAASRHSRASH